jgi:hypothetical protein
MVVLCWARVWCTRSRFAATWSLVAIAAAAVMSYCCHVDGVRVATLLPKQMNMALLHLLQLLQLCYICCIASCSEKQLLLFRYFHQIQLIPFFCLVSISKKVSKMTIWEFPIFVMNEKVAHPLVYMGLGTLSCLHEFDKKFKMDADVLSGFLWKVESGYKNNPYVFYLFDLI